MPDPSNKMDPEPRVTCAGCGGRHGGVNAEWNCMRRRIRELEAQLRQAPAHGVSAAQFEANERQSAQFLRTRVKRD